MVNSMIHPYLKKALPEISMVTMFLLFTNLLYAVEPDKVGLEFFESRIRPILVNHCYKCHSELNKQAKGGLSLDTRSSIQKGGDNGPAIVPGNVQESLLLQAVDYDGAFYDMPPAGKLSETQIGDLRKWVEMGAPDPRLESVFDNKNAVESDSKNSNKSHWAFQTVKKPTAPVTINREWSCDPMDQFILTRLENKGISPAPMAKKTDWLRRVWFDLVGLPPTAEAIEKYLKDQSTEQKARETVVDELLSKPQFGERWGRHWLDVARYAESSGGGRTLLFKDAWRYRDYVINAFNSDMPYNQFLQEQIAGDLLPAQTDSDRMRQLTATGFLVLGPTNYEEQDKYQLRMDIVDEQIDTLGRTAMGMTLGCARCHDHKFDPIPTSDYYAIAGIFRSTRTLQNDTDNVAHWVETALPVDHKTQEELLRHEQSVHEIKSLIKSLRTQLIKLDSRTSKLAGSGPVKPEDLPGIVIDDMKAKSTGVWKVSGYGGKYVGVGAVYDEKSKSGHSTLTFGPAIPKSGRYEVRLAYVPHSNRATNTLVTILHADGEELKHVNQRLEPPIEGRFLSLGTFRFETGGAGLVVLSNEGADGLVSVDALWFVPVEEFNQPEAKKPVEINPVELIDKRKELAALEKQLSTLQKQAPSKPVAMTLRDHEKPGESPIHIRGNSKTLGRIVPRGGLSVISGVPFGSIQAGTSGRSVFAKWLTDNRHPLTARVMVNRIWLWVFGDGLVTTADNFGTTGQLPTNPDLLDHLATRFMENGWSVKHLLRDIVLSKTYAMSDRKTPESEQKDPQNLLLSRFPRRRLDAESMRDAMLMSAGVLDMRVGGPNIEGATSIDSNDAGAALVEYGYQFRDFRRSVYTPAFRNKRLELFEAFDFADINQPIGRREQSIVVTQALFLMNHSFVQEMAGRTAKRLLLLPINNDRARLDQIALWIVSRPLTEAESKILLPIVFSVSGQKDPENAWAKVAHALFASVEFRYTH